MEKSGSAARHPMVMRFDTLTSMRVRNPEGDDLGLIDDLVFDRESGHIRYAVLSFGGFLGLGDRLFAIPWNAFQISPADNKLVLNVKKEALKNAPGFDRDRWPNMSDADWGGRVHSHYGVRPYWEM
jgi:sporulation protein YlmC with PRC-barrel domain